MGDRGACGFAGRVVGKTTRMKRAELLQQIRVATTPNEILTALADARTWLRVHPRDHEVAFSMLDLLSVERHALGSAS